MDQLRFVVSLTTEDNEYQREQRVAAESAAQRLGVIVEHMYAHNDIFEQTQQLSEIIQVPRQRRPNAIIMEPVSGTGLSKVAEAAIAAGIGWVVLNCDVAYVSDLRTGSMAPVFVITSDHLEIGRIQGRQLGALLPQGGTVLHVQGPSISVAANQRTKGMFETKPANVHIKAVRGYWTEESATKAVGSWLSLTDGGEAYPNLVSCQDDSMAMGARKAFEKQFKGSEQAKRPSLSFTGVDGLPQEGQYWVKQGLLAATVVAPANAGTAVEMLVQSFRNKSEVPERTLTVPMSYPPLQHLSPDCSSGL